MTFTNELKTQAGLSVDISAKNSNDWDAFLVVESHGVVSGFATFGQFRAGPRYAKTVEHSVILAPSAQGSGVGRRLMGALFDQARHCGAHSMFAGVSGENPAGVAFHAALGFDVIATLSEVGFKFNRWMDLILMQKML